ncbi:MAG: ABC transporter permease [Candidatus Sumerlaeia bacterium]|nr:ABC transporter permease [Candidatus Sumerlaeia bacterium]
MRKNTLPLSTRVLRFVLPPMIFFLLFLGGWDLAVKWFEIPAYLLPGPKPVFQSAVANGRVLALASLLTAAAAAAGFLVSVVIGLIVAFLFSQSAWIQRAGYPYAMFFQTVPVVAIAPLIVIWFGSDFRSIVITSAIVGLFPIITTGTAGLTNLDRNMVELFDLNNASRWQKLWKLRFPNSIPYLVAGAKTSSGLSVVGAIIGEFFAGFGQQRYGLGYLIFQANAALKTDLMVAATIASTLLGLLIFGVVGLAGHLALRRWHHSAH